jgi:hypothetical protein
MTELNEAESEEDRIMAENCLKTHEAKWPAEFIRGKYDCTGEGQQQL